LPVEVCFSVYRLISLQHHNFNMDSHCQREFVKYQPTLEVIAKHRVKQKDLY
jgi:hypothetical protein